MSTTEKPPAILISPEREPLVTAPEARARNVRQFWARLPRSGQAAAVVLGVVVVGAILAPVISPDSPDVGAISQRLEHVGADGHLLGTDGQGRDLLSRLIWGARPTLITGFVPVVVASVIGGAIGVWTGLAGRKTNTVVMRILDVFYAFPAILLAIAVATILGSGMSNAIIALAIILVPPLARLAEAETSQLRNLDFMEAAEASGARRVTIAWRHVVPNVAPPLVVYSTALIGLSIIYAAGLSFLGIGIQPPKAEWGLMLSDLLQDVFTAPTLVLVPAIAIFLVSVCCNVLGDGLRDALDVRSEVR
jgi:peptide/nickel transport system permease protein